MRRAGTTGPEHVVTCERWLDAGTKAAEIFGVSKIEVEVHVDARVGFVNPRCVTQ